MAADSTACDTLADLVRRAPGRAASSAALHTLHELATHGDPAAGVAMSRLVARALGFGEDTPGLLTARSPVEVSRAADVAPVVRAYAAAFLPRDLMASPEHVGSAPAAEHGFAEFQALVRRDAPIRHEALKALLLRAFADMCQAGGGNQPAVLPRGPRMVVLDQILTGARVVDGHGTADSKFEFGRAGILRMPGIGALYGVFFHEVGHHVVDHHQPELDLLPPATGPESTQQHLIRVMPILLDDGTPLASGRRLVEELAEVLPDLVAAAHRPQATAPLAHRLPDGLSIMCTISPLGDGNAYTHVSLTDAGGPLDLEVALPLALAVVRLLGVDPTTVVLAQSARGVFHLGFVGTAPETDQVRRRAAAHGAEPWEPLEAEAAEWYGDLASAGRVGRTQLDVPYILGLAERSATAHGPDPENAQRDLGIRAGVARMPELPPISDEVRAELLRVAVRCGDPVMLERVCTPGVEAADPDLPLIGSSLFAVRADDGCTYFGPNVDDLLAVLAVLRARGFDVDRAATDGPSLLTDAAGRGPDLVRRLLALGLDPARPDGTGRTPLSRAAEYGDAEVIALLLDAGAPIDGPDKDGATALHQATTTGNAAALELLLARGADVNARSGDRRTALMLAPSPAEVRRLWEAGAELEAADTAGSTPLITAARRGESEVVRALLEIGADVGATTDRGASALHIAAEQPSWRPVPELIDLLVEAGAEIDEETDEGLTPLHSAAAVRSDQAIERLVAFGADVSARDRHGRTPLLLAADGRKRNGAGIEATTRSLRLLADAGADVNASDDDGATALLLATFGTDADPVDVLLSLGADPAAGDHHGVTPLGNARRQKHDEMVSKLRAADARDLPDAGSPGDHP